MSALAAARVHNDEYQRRINLDGFQGDMTDRMIWEDRAYQQAMMQAAIAQAEALEQIATLLQSMALVQVTEAEAKQKVKYLPRR